MPTCSSCGAGITWLTCRSNRVPFDRLPVVDTDDPSQLAMPCYRGEAWALDDLVLELQATYHWTPGQARRHVREQLPWHVPHTCATDPDEEHHDL